MIVVYGGIGISFWQRWTAVVLYCSVDVRKLAAASAAWWVRLEATRRRESKTCELRLALPASWLWRLVAAIRTVSFPGDVPLLRKANIRGDNLPGKKTLKPRKCRGIWRLSWKCQETDQKSGKYQGIIREKYLHSTLHRLPVLVCIPSHDIKFRRLLQHFCPLAYYPRDAMLARVFATATCLSVRLSVCLDVRHTPVLCLAERKQDREVYTTW